MKTKAFLFFALVFFAVALLTLGITLWQATNTNIVAYDNSFTTIGLVNQRENSVVISAHWNAATKQHIYTDKPVYDSIAPLSVLDFDGAQYLVAPQQRPFYGAYVPELLVRSSDHEETARARWGSIVAFVPYEDCTPDKPVRVKISKVYWGLTPEGQDRWICDHYNDNPSLLEAGKTYITAVQTSFNQHMQEVPEAMAESFPANLTVSTQIGADGQPLAKQDLSALNWVEMTDGFFATAEGGKWVALVDAMERFMQTLPVVPTGSTNVLLSFHQGDATIRNGRDITQEEYASGERVCLVPQKLVSLNNLKIGQKILLQLYFAEYERSSSQMFMPGTGIGEGGVVLSVGLLNAEGKLYPVFEDNLYEIVGVYQQSLQAGRISGYEMGDNAIIIPMNSIQNSDENNIVANGPMKGYTTSFQIPNGSISDYMEKFSALGIPNLEIAFYDGGYEQLKAGMQNLKLVAVILAAVSTAVTLAILVFFAHLFIAKQKKRTAIERSLGVTKRSAMESLLLSIVLVALPGVAIGGTVGYVVANNVLSGLEFVGTELYSTAFSNWVNNADSTQVAGVIGANPWVSVALCAAVLAVDLGLSLWMARGNVRAEPLKILSKSGD